LLTFDYLSNWGDFFVDIYLKKILSMRL